MEADSKRLGRNLRALWATLAAICLVVAGTVYGVTRYRQYELETQATRVARKLAVGTLKPMLTERDVRTPVRGERYDELSSMVDARVLAGPFKALRIWAPNGTVLFAEQPDLVGDREPAMHAEIKGLAAGEAESVVTGVRFRTLTLLRIGEPSTPVAVELIRSHAAIVERSRDPWYPWVGRALVAAIVFAALYVVTALALMLFGILRRRARDRSNIRDASVAHPQVRSQPQPRSQPPSKRGAAAASDEGLPAYMSPGFREEVEARREAEEELSTMRQQHDDLTQRLRRTEQELAEARTAAPRA